MKLICVCMMMAVSATLSYGACSGHYVNKSGAGLHFDNKGGVMMEFNGNKAKCETSSKAGNLTITCGPGMHSTGKFSKKCDSIEFNGVVWHRK